MFLWAEGKGEQLVEPAEREGEKIRAGGGGGPLGEDRFRSFLGFFSFFVVSPSNYKMLPPCGNSV